MSKAVQEPLEAARSDPAFDPSDPPPGALLALGFGTTVAMWATAYVCRLPWVMAPGAVLAVAFVLAYVVGGVWAGRRLPAVGVTLGLKVGGLASLLNLLILGSVFKDVLGNNAAQWFLWVPGTIVLGGALSAIGYAVGRAWPAPIDDTNWSGAFARVTALATLVLLGVGGLVTSHEAGLAVPDWPNTYTSNMFLYPLSRMTGGIYLEHAHRLFGSLVGLTTLVLAVHIHRTEARPWVKHLATGAFVLVVCQGMLGGMRVTGAPTLSTAAEDLSPNIGLAIVHGVTGQLFFGLIVALSAILATTWRREDAGVELTDTDAADESRLWCTALLALVVVQLILGALVRHIDFEVTWHITGGVLVLMGAVATGVRVRSLHADQPELPRWGVILIAIVGLQLVLGFVALAVTSAKDSGGALAAHDGWVTTLHQTVGALVLATVVLVSVWAYRFLPRATSPSKA